MYLNSMSDSDFAWAAGFLDGEGSFIVARISSVHQRHAGVVRRKPAMSADQVHPSPLNKLRLVLGGTVSSPKRKTAAGNTIYRWQTNSASNLRIILPRLIPHLTLKKRQAKLLLEYAETFRPREGRQLKLTPQEIMIRTQIEEQLKEAKNGL